MTNSPRDYMDEGTGRMTSGGQVKGGVHGVAEALGLGQKSDSESVGVPNYGLWNGNSTYNTPADQENPQRFVQLRQVQELVAQSVDGEEGASLLRLLACADVTAIEGVPCVELSRIQDDVKNLFTTFSEQDGERTPAIIRNVLREITMMPEFATQTSYAGMQLVRNRLTDVLNPIKA